MSNATYSVGQLAVDEKEGHLKEGTLLSQLLDGIATITEDTIGT